MLVLVQLGETVAFLKHTIIVAEPIEKLPATATGVWQQPFGNVDIWKIRGDDFHEILVPCRNLFQFSDHWARFFLPEQKL